MRRRLLPLLVAGLVGCADAAGVGTDSGPSGASASSSPESTSAPGPPALALIDVHPESAPSVTNGPAPAPFDGAFAPVALPAGTPNLVRVAGRTDDDVWLLAANDGVLSWNGKAATTRGAPDCYAEACCAGLVDCHATPALCDRAKADACQIGDSRCALHVGFDGIEFSNDGGVVATAIVKTYGMRGGLIEARLEKSGAWTCAQRADDLVYPGARASGDVAHAYERVIDGVTIRWEGPAVLMNLLGGFSLAIDGRRVLLPELPAQSFLGFEAAAPDDLWLWSQAEPRLFHGNGLDWTSVPTPVASILTAWIDPAHRAWVLGWTGAQADSAILLQRDRERWIGTAVPGADRVLPTKDGFVLLGPNDVYVHDGTALRRTSPPLRIADAWVAPGGDLWLVGGAGTGAAPKPATPSAAAAFRLALPKRIDP